MSYLQESLEMLGDPEVPPDEAGRNLYQMLNVPGVINAVERCF